MAKKDVPHHFCLRSIGVALPLFVMAGCVGAFDPYSPDQIHRTVQDRGPGLYVVYYKWPYVIEHYGPDMESQLKGAEEGQIAGIWKKAFAVAVPRYLQAKSLIPPECGRGVEVVRNGETEGGHGWAEFRCK